MTLEEYILAHIDEEQLFGRYQPSYLALVNPGYSRPLQGHTLRISAR